MSAERATYLDSSAIVKLAVREPESAGLRKYLRRKRPLVTSALARTEVARALLPFGREALARGTEAINLDGIHLATATHLGDDLARVCTYDDRMADAAVSLGFTVAAPA